MRPPLPRIPSLHPVALSLLALAAAALPAADHPAPTGENPELAATVKMFSAHATLRSAAVADPDSAANIQMLDTMVRKTVESGPSLPPPPPVLPRPDAPLVGTLDGRFSVDNRGAANYDITLQIPESRADLGPDPSISYYSGAGSGILGEGFSFSTGFYRAITRGRTILARDDEVRSAELSPADHYYLDGKRLLCTSAPETDGRPGSVYRTEVDSFVEITALGTGEDIDTFRMRTKHGRIFFFGKLGASDDAFHRGYDEDTGRLDPKAMTYALKRVEDPLGNYVEFTYTHKGFGDWVLTEIAYTGRPGLAPAYTINLSYVPKCPRVPRYRALRRFDENQLLELIRVRAAAGTAIVAEYKLAYGPVGEDGAQRLESISTALAADINAPLEALPPTRFHWSQGSPTSALLRVSPPAPTAGAPDDLSTLGDFNGDGKQDFLSVRDGLQVALSSRDGFGDVTTEWIAKATLDRILGNEAGRSLQLGDVDGDGLTDVLLAAATGKLCLLRSTGTSFQLLCTLDVGPLLRPRGSEPDRSALPRITLGDFNGDGRKDLLVHSFAGGRHLLLSNGTSFTEPPRPEEPRPPPAGGEELEIRSLATDLNSDGLDDYVWLEEPTPTAPRRLRYALAMPDGTFAEPLTLHTWAAEARPGIDSALLCGNFNGDDQPDFLVGDRSPAAPGRREWTLLLSRSHPTSLRTTAVATVTRFAQAIPESWTLPDGSVLATFPESTAPTASQAAPPPAAPSCILPLELGTGNALCASTGDINQDGRDDFVWFNRGRPATSGEPTVTTPCWWVCLSNGDGSFAPPRRLTGAPWDEAARLATDAAPGAGADNAVAVRRESDLDGDGRADWTLEKTNGDGRRSLCAAYRHTAPAGNSCPFRNLVTAITDGRSSAISIGYKAAKDDAIYTPGAPVAYPIRELRSSLPVVSEKWGDTAGDLPSQFSYHYAANRIDFAGRGTLGFGAFTTLDQQTGFMKFQFLAHSFPMTGLTARDQTYRFWQHDGTVWIKLISTKDNSVVFDAVVDPASGRPWGTVFPFTARTVESHWPNDSSPDFSYPSHSTPPNPSNVPLIGPRPRTPPSSRTTTSHWFDGQDPEKEPQLRCPPVSSPYVLSADYVAPPERPKRAASPRFPGLIIYGNERVTYTDLGGGHFKKESKTYRRPAGPNDPLTSLLETENTTEFVDTKGTVTAPAVTKGYFAGTSLLEREVSKASKTGGTEPRLLTETIYQRDSLGRILLRRVRTLDLNKPKAGVKVETPYTASAFDEQLDLATDEVEEGSGRMKSRYNPLCREWSEVRFESGAFSTADHDALGRQIRVSNTANGYLKTVDYAWTAPDGEGWRRLQKIRPPPGVTGINLTSSHAVRVAKTGKPTTTTYYDRTDRIIRVLTEETDGSATCVDSVFNLLNQLVAESKPYAPGTEAGWTIKRYDDYGSVTNESVVEPARPKTPKTDTPRTGPTAGSGS